MKMLPSKVVSTFTDILTDPRQLTTGAPTYYFCKIFAENCVKAKEEGAGASSLDPPLWYVAVQKNHNVL